MYEYTLHRHKHGTVLVDDVRVFEGEVQAFLNLSSDVGNLLFKPKSSTFQPGKQNETSTIMLQHKLIIAGNA